MLCVENATYCINIYYYRVISIPVACSLITEKIKPTIIIMIIINSHANRPFNV